MQVEPSCAEESPKIVQRISIISSMVAREPYAIGYAQQLKVVSELGISEVLLYETLIDLSGLLPDSMLFKEHLLQLGQYSLLSCIQIAIVASRHGGR